MRRSDGPNGPLISALDLKMDGGDEVCTSRCEQRELTGEAPWQ